ncbi:MAG: two-component system phosphate regulon sensor histidine kinase PhoR [Flavobacteriales bacterium]|jgi:two-component system phosphate regulon sensor histidine kinase PhoR
MKKRLIQILIILMSTGFVGLIAIQIYWINNSILLRQQEFDFNVGRALNKVVQGLERQEYISQVQQNKESPQVKLSRHAEDDQSGLVVEFEHEDHIDTVDAFPTEIVPLETHKHVHELETELVEAQKSSATRQERDSVLYSEWGEYGLEQSQILEQAGFLDDIMDGVMTMNIYKSVTERVDLDGLDSLLKAELGNQGINAKYKVGVFNRFHQAELLNEDDQDCIDEFFSDGYKAQLFPNDPVSDPNYLRVFFPYRNHYLLRTMWVMLALSAILILVIMLAFSYAITTIYRQKQISEVKNDFINNMTHELKTPISTISLACEALSDPDMMSSQKQLKTFVGMIQDENRRLGVLVENVLRSAILDKGEMELNIVRLNVHELIETVIKNIAIQIKKKGGRIKTDLTSLNPVVEGDRVHVTNVVYNLIDNAIKYSLESPEVTISTEDREGGVVLSFKDNGMGINKENQKKIFDKLYRVPTGNVHNVKGFGLGLSYVKAVVEKHNGEITVDSELNQGSTFNIYLPATHEK